MSFERWWQQIRCKQVCTHKMTEEDSTLINKGNFSKKILIVGAGISGLACAKSLKEFGFENVSILEARDRIGGRINRFKFGSDALELGAQWIHGQENNVIYEIAECKDLINYETFNYLDAVRSFKTFTEEERKALIRLFNFLDEKVDHISKTYGSGISLSSYLDEQFKIFLSAFDSSSFTLLQNGYEWYCTCLLITNGCDSLSLLSLKLYNNYKDCEGNPVVEVKNGLSSILDTFLNALPMDWILRNKCVTKIDWSDFKEGNEANKNFESNSIKNVKVVCEDGEIFLADHVVITIPLGCLKSNYQSLFIPKLSKSRQRAIQCLGFGTVNKIFFYFKEPFWDGPAFFPVFRYHLQDSKEWLQYINSFAYTPGCSNVLCTWVAGKGAVLMESLSANEVISDCMKILENILKKKLSLPSQMYRSSWHSDPFACGSYSFLSIDCEKEGLLPSAIAEPEYASSAEHPVLLFAGEATNNSHFATVHGAYETGVREAERLFQYYK